MIEHVDEYGPKRNLEFVHHEIPIEMKNLSFLRKMNDPHIEFDIEDKV